MDVNYNQILNEILDNVSSVLDLSDYEKTMITDGLLIVRKPLPSTKLKASEDLANITKSCSDYNYILTKLRSARLKVLATYKPEYDKKFTILTRQGRPSREAISSEIHYTNPDMSTQRSLLEKIDSVEEFLKFQLSVLDKYYRAIDSRQYAM